MSLVKCLPSADWILGSFLLTISAARQFLRATKFSEAALWVSLIFSLHCFWIETALKKKKKKKKKKAWLLAVKGVTYYDSTGYFAFCTVIFDGACPDKRSDTVTFSIVLSMSPNKTTLTLSSYFYLKYVHILVMLDWSEDYQDNNLSIDDAKATTKR